MLLITGTQRCGTSLTADFVRACGYPVSGAADEVGKYENAEIAMAYRYILNDHTFPWSTYPFVLPPEEVRPLHSIDGPVAKFSFLMMDPRLMRIWIEHRRHKRDRLLILVRETEKVCRSKRNTAARAEQFSTDSAMLQISPAQLKQNWFDSFMVLLNSGLPYWILKFPRFVDDYPSVRLALRDFGQLEEIPEEPHLWNSMIDRTKITAE
jgi:hypothetical protein